MTQSHSKSYRVSWTETVHCWGRVDATSKEEAIEKAELGDFVMGTIDSDPGEQTDEFKAEEIEKHS